MGEQPPHRPERDHNRRVPKPTEDDVATAAAFKGMTKAHLAHCERLNALARAIGEEPVLEALVEYSIRAQKNPERRFVRRLTVAPDRMVQRLRMERLQQEGHLSAAAPAGQREKPSTPKQSNISK
jgi:hypothetical protein